VSDGKLVGIVGAGRLGQAMAWTALRAGRHVMLANSCGPDTLDSVIAPTVKVDFSSDCSFGMWQSPRRN
jgi:predicted dinucleotide-binding enzyme